MKTIQPLVLAAIVLGSSACTNNSLKQPPSAELSGALSTSERLIASAVEAPPSTVAITPLSTDTDATNGTAADAIASPVAASIQTAQTDANVLNGMTQDEQEAEAPYAAPAVRDPWEGFNRKMHSFNNVLDRFVFRPIAVGYDKITPDPVQSGVSRFFSNLRLPATAINQALQGRPGDAGQSLGRFVVNSTAGIGGVFDPAKHSGMPEPDGEDLGQTLATWGWRDSRYLVMPIIGPRTVRDVVGGGGDQQLSLISQIDSSSVLDKLQIMQIVDVRAQRLLTDQMRKDAIDDYAFVRDNWGQRRNRQIGQALLHKSPSVP